MKNDENTNKVGYGSWFLNQGHTKEASQQCFERFTSETNIGEKVKIKYIGGAKPTVYTGVIADMGINHFGEGYTVLQQNNKEKVLKTSYIDEVEIIGRSF